MELFFFWSPGAILQRRNSPRGYLCETKFSIIAIFYFINHNKILSALYNFHGTIKISYRENRKNISRWERVHFKYCKVYSFKMSFIYLYKHIEILSTIVQYDTVHITVCGLLSSTNLRKIRNTNVSNICVNAYTVHVFILFIQGKNSRQFSLQTQKIVRISVTGRLVK